MLEVTFRPILGRPNGDTPTSAGACLVRAHFAVGAVDVGRSASELLSKRKYWHSSYTQTDDTRCWPWNLKGKLENDFHI